MRQFQLDELELGRRVAHWFMVRWMRADQLPVYQLTEKYQP